MNIQDKVAQVLTNMWLEIDNTDKTLGARVKENVYRGNVGAEELLDWCRCDYDNFRKQYKTLHGLTEEQMSELLDKHYGTYDFMYNDIPFVQTLDEIWEICNLYLDYCEGILSERDLLNELNCMF